MLQLPPQQRLPAFFLFIIIMIAITTAESTSAAVMSVARLSIIQVSIASSYTKAQKNSRKTNE